MSPSTQITRHTPTPHSHTTHSPHTLTPHTHTTHSHPTHSPHTPHTHPHALTRPHAGSGGHPPPVTPGHPSVPPRRPDCPAPCCLRLALPRALKSRCGASLPSPACRREALLPLGQRGTAGPRGRPGPQRRHQSARARGAAPEHGRWEGFFSGDPAPSRLRRGPCVAAGLGTFSASGGLAGGPGGSPRPGCQLPRAFSQGQQGGSSPLPDM